jgi:hypothetical protein
VPRFLSAWIADKPLMLIKLLKIRFMADNLFIMLYFATPLSLPVPGSHHPDRLIASDLNRIISTLLVKWSN